MRLGLSPAKRPHKRQWARNIADARRTRSSRVASRVATAIPAGKGQGGAKRGPLRLGAHPSEQSLDGLHQILRPGLGGEAVHHPAFTVNQELGEVPLDGLAAKEPGLLLLEPAIEGVGTDAVDLAFGHQGEADRVVERAEAGDLLGIARLLMAELIAGKAQDLEALGAELAIEGLKPGVLGGKTAAACHVDHQHDTALQIGGGPGRAIESLQGDEGQGHGFS